MRPELAESSPPPLFSFFYFFQVSFGTAVGGYTSGVGGLAVLATTSTRAPDKKRPKIDNSKFYR